MVEHGGWHGRRGARRAGVWLDAVLEAALRCTAVLADAVGSSREPHRRSRRRHGFQQLLSRSSLLTRPRTHHALEQGCCASLCARPTRVAGGSAVLTESDHVRWNTMNSAACCAVCGEKLRCGPPTPVH